jgi:hypothetical protein
MNKIWILFGFMILSGNLYSQCQQHIISSAPSSVTEFSTFQYVDCVDGDTSYVSIPCCGYTYPFCAMVGSVQLVVGNAFSAVLVNEVGPPWESCIPYNEPPCPYDFNLDNVVSVSDLLTILSTEPAVGDMAGFLSVYGSECN